MKKTAILVLSVVLSLSAMAQKKDSLVVQITMDTTTFKNCVQLIQENINGNTATGKTLLQSILVPFYQNIKLVPREADKPKEIEPKK